MLHIDWAPPNCETIEQGDGVFKVLNNGGGGIKKIQY